MSRLCHEGGARLTQAAPQKGEEERRGGHLLFSLTRAVFKVGGSDRDSLRGSRRHEGVEDLKQNRKGSWKGITIWLTILIRFNRPQGSLPLVRTRELVELKETRIGQRENGRGGRARGGVNLTTHLTVEGDYGGGFMGEKYGGRRTFGRQTICGGGIWLRVAS